MISSFPMTQCNNSYLGPIYGGLIDLFKKNSCKIEPCANNNYGNVNSSKINAIS